MARLFDAKGGAGLQEPQNVLLRVATRPSLLDLQRRQTRTLQS